MSQLTMSQFTVQTLLDTGTVRVRDVLCSGECRHKSEEECTAATHLVFPYRGVFVRHVGRNDAVAEANQLLFFNNAEGYRISHPVEGGDSCLDLVVEEAQLQELTPKEQLRSGSAVAFRRQRRRIDPRAQALVAVLRHSLSRNIAETLEAETLALTLVRALPRRGHLACRRRQRWPAEAGRSRQARPVLGSFAALDAGRDRH